MVTRQQVRLLDVAVFGPLSIYAALHPRKLPYWLRGFLFLYGAATVVYNLHNYLKGGSENV